MTGYQFTWKPGTYVFERSARDARTLYSNLILLGFLDLPVTCDPRDDWRNVIGPGDGTSLVFSLRANGLERKVVNMGSCSGELPAHETLLAMQREIHAATALEPYLEVESVECSEYIDSMTLLAGVVVRDANDDAVGLLQTTLHDRRPEWNLTSCDGEPIARGQLSPWGCDVSFISADETTFSWPGVKVRPSAAVLHDVRAGRAEFPITLHTFDVELRQRAERGTACNRAR